MPLILPDDMWDEIMRMDLIPVLSEKLYKLQAVVVLDHISTDDVLNKAVYLMRENYNVAVDGWLKLTFTSPMEASQALAKSYYRVADRSDYDAVVNAIVYDFSDLRYFYFAGAKRMPVNIRTGELDES